VGVAVAVGVDVGGVVGVAVPPLHEPLSVKSAGTFGGSQPTSDVCGCRQV
jgi:hypothetical protein